MKLIISLIIILGIFLTDLKGWFLLSDLSFFLALIVYMLFLRKWALAISLFFLAVMSYFFIRTGISNRVERVGEWFYIFFVIGVIQNLVTNVSSLDDN
jgi:hypothetical protein